jgi:hypothetical protein
MVFKNRPGPRQKCSQIEVNSHDCMDTEGRATQESTPRDANLGAIASGTRLTRPRFGGAFDDKIVGNNFERTKCDPKVGQLFKIDPANFVVSFHA